MASKNSKGVSFLVKRSTRQRRRFRRVQTRSYDSLTESYLPTHHEFLGDPNQMHISSTLPFKAFRMQVQVAKGDTTRRRFVPKAPSPHWQERGGLRQTDAALIQALTKDFAKTFPPSMYVIVEKDLPKFFRRWLNHLRKGMAQLPVKEEVRAMSFEPSIASSEKSSSLSFEQIQEENIQLASTITYPPTKQNIQDVIDFLYNKCTSASKSITSQHERAQLENIVSQWSHFLRMFDKEIGKMAYVPLDWVKV